jgi:hypothetical protein
MEFYIGAAVFVLIIFLYEMVKHYRKNHHKHVYGPIGYGGAGWYYLECKSKNCNAKEIG